MTTYTYKDLGAEGHGRLGNQLWQIAWQIGQAKGDPEHVAVNPNWEYRPYFSLPEVVYEQHGSDTIDGESGFFQELYHWDGYEQQVWEWFQPSAFAVEYMQSVDPGWTDGIAKCSIHHRRGDYLVNPHMFPQLTEKYYETAIREVQEENPDTTFLVFSDDFGFISKRYEDQSCFVCVQGVERSVDPRWRTGEPSDQWDLFRQLSCDRHIIANSSFSWWGAFLSESQQAYYPNTWWGVGLKSVDSRGLLSNQTWREGIPSWWTEIEC